jgi:hypothetical protein
MRTLGTLTCIRFRFQPEWLYFLRRAHPRDSKGRNAPKGHKIIGEMTSAFPKIFSACVHSAYTKPISENSVTLTPWFCW